MVFHGGGESWYDEPMRQLQLLQFAWHFPVRYLVDHASILYTLARLAESQVTGTDLLENYFVEGLSPALPQCKSDLYGARQLFLVNELLSFMERNLSADKTCVALFIGMATLLAGGLASGVGEVDLAHSAIINCNLT